MAAKPSIPKGTRDFSPVEYSIPFAMYIISMVSNRLKRLQWKCFPH